MSNADVRAMIRERVLAGLARAKEHGTRLRRRRIEDTDAAKAATIRAALASGKGIRSQGRCGNGIAIEGGMRCPGSARDALVGVARASMNAFHQR
jgi:hypothetical protein